MVHKSNLRQLCENICINSTAFLKTENGVVNELIGNRIECSLLKFCFKMGYYYEDFRPSP